MLASDSLIKEYAGAVVDFIESDIRDLERMGVRPEITTGLITDYVPVGIVAAETSHSGSWQPYESGRQLLVSPVVHGTVKNLEIYDIVAWDPSEPDRLWHRTGNGVVLNPDAVFTAALEQRWEDEAAAIGSLRIFENPLSWLRAGCKGVVILDWRRCIPLHLSNITDVRCETDDLARRLYDAYTIDDRPNFYKRKGQSLAA